MPGPGPSDWSVAPSPACSTSATALLMWLSACRWPCFALAFSSRHYQVSYEHGYRVGGENIEREPQHLPKIHSNST